MNKKIFTLLASSLMLFFIAFTANAQVPITGDTVRYLPNGVGKGAYHLQVTHVGTTDIRHGGVTPSTEEIVLGLDSAGYLYLYNAHSYANNTYNRLREGMWCVEVDYEVDGAIPTFSFVNKEYASELAVWDGNFRGAGWGLYSEDPSVAAPGTLIRPQIHGGNNVEQVLVGGEYLEWAFSRSHKTVPMETDQPLRIQLKDQNDYFLTFIIDPDNYTPGTPSLGTGAGVHNYNIRLVRVHADDLKEGSAIYDYLLRFTLVNAAPRVLSVADFNTKIGEQSEATTRSEGGVKLFFDPEATEGNVFSESGLWASQGTNVTGTSAGQYLFIQDYASKEFIYASDESSDKEYYSDLGFKYPVLKKGAKKTNGRGEFRFVYYPSEDSLVINVRAIDNPTYAAVYGGNTYYEDQGGYLPALGVGPSIFQGLYNWDVHNALIVRMQDLDAALGKRVLTVWNAPSLTRAHFGIKNCDLYDKNRTTVESGLYTITDSRGYYLVVDLETGDYTPRWRQLLSTDNISNEYGSREEALKTPSFQWMVTKIYKNLNTSRIHITNREFDHIRLEYVQVHNEYTPIRGHENWLSNTNPNATYNPVWGKLVRKDGFVAVYDDKEAAEMKAKLGADWMSKMPEKLMQKLYRTSPFIGYKYIAPDTLNYYGYALNLLDFKSNDQYIGLKDINGGSDSLMHIDREATYFEFELPDSLRKYIGSRRPTELYGIGYNDDLLKDITSDGKTFDNTSSKDYIAKLERSYYYVKVNDYWRYKLGRNDQYIVIDDGGRYAFTDEPNANKRKLNKAKVYMRFAYEDKAERENYILIDRIDKSNFHYLTSQFNLSITDTLKAYDDSHGSIRTSAFGVVQFDVEEYNDIVKFAIKMGSNTRTSAFALKQVTEPLYRRFNVTTTDGGERDDDTPRLLKFHNANDKDWYLYEDAYSQLALPHGQYPRINYLGFEDAVLCKQQQANNEGHWHASHNYIIYVDTAYVNRGTGWIKPQYLLVMDPKISEKDSGRVTACGDPVYVDRYVYGRYLINATDSARQQGFLTATHSAIRDEDYIYDTYERLAFVDAIHMGDSLYILKGHDISYFYAKCYKGEKPDEYLSKGKLLTAANQGKIDIHRLDNNLHKDVVFSMRFIERQVDAKGNPTGNPKTFYIESETTNRSATKGRMIAPMNGGWVKIQNFAPVISRGTFYDNIVLPQEFDVEPAGTNDPGAATSTDDTAVDAVKVIGGAGNVTVLNAAGKKAVITNILGQTVATTTLDNDNAIVSAPKGIVIVTVEGEDAVKAVVK